MEMGGKGSRRTEKDAISSVKRKKGRTPSRKKKGGRKIKERGKGQEGTAL